MSSIVNVVADISLQPVVFGTHDNAEKSLQLVASAACLRAPMALAANGKSGTLALIGPISRTNLLTILRAGLPEKTVVIVVC